MAAEAEARDKKRKAEGKPPLELESGGGSAGESGGDEESNKRRKLLQDAEEERTYEGSVSDLRVLLGHVCHISSVPWLRSNLKIDDLRCDTSVFVFPGL